MKHSISSITLISLLTLASISNATEAPKYGPKESPRATPLALSNEYFRDPQQRASAFWALISYYIPQTTGASCGTATLAMTLNAARAHMKKTASDAVITEKMLWNNVDANLWKEKPNEPKYQGLEHGISLEQLGKIAELALKNYGFKNAKVKTVQAEKSDRIRSEMIKDLKTLSDQHFIMANFNQKTFTNDADVGHFAPVGAFDEKRGRVLILDPDRGSLGLDGFYEPYWVSVDTFFEGITTQDSSKKKNRGYILVDTQGN